MNLKFAFVFLLDSVLLSAIMGDIRITLLHLIFMIGLGVIRSDVFMCTIIILRFVIFTYVVAHFVIEIILFKNVSICKEKELVSEASDLERMEGNELGFMKRFNHFTRTSLNGIINFLYWEEAVEIMNDDNHEVDILITDYNLGTNMNAIKMILKVEKKPSVSICASGFSEREILKENCEVDEVFFDEFISKPILIGPLKGCLSKFVKRLGGNNM